MLLYDQRYAFCGLRIISVDEQDLVDGAHVKPFLEFRDGSLCKCAGAVINPPTGGLITASWGSGDYRIVILQERFMKELTVESREIVAFIGRGDQATERMALLNM